MTATGARRLHGEDGATLAELLTVMAVSGVVLAFVTGTVVGAMQSQRRQTTQVSALNDAKRAFERVTRDIRGADPLWEAAPDRIRLGVRRADDTVRTVTYQRVGDSLVATDAATGRATTLVGDLVPARPLFLFHLVDGSTVTGEVAFNPRSVRSVTVRLQVEPDGAGRVVDLDNRVLIRNHIEGPIVPRGGEDEED